jgi:hypothetical protein
MSWITFALGRLRSEPALMHRMGFAHEDVRCNLVFGAAEFPERRQQRQVVECLFRQSQAQRPSFRAVFRASHLYASQLFSESNHDSV